MAQLGKNPMIKWEEILKTVMKNKTMHHGQVRFIPRMSGGVCIYKTMDVT